MKKLILAGAMALALAGPAAAQTFTGPIAQADTDPAPVTISVSGTLQIIAASGFKTIYVTGGLIYAGGTTNLTFKAGTGTNCGTGTRSLSGPIPLKDQGGFVPGGGLGIALRLRGGEALCITTDQSVAVGGWLTFGQR